ncbi:MAG: hypothetical protein KAX31_01805, partial [Thermoplasmata archaeon]|nr:hypothetical protein [Thermoplasmata archaeon]
MPKRKWGKSTSSKRFQHLANKGKSNGITNANVNPLQSQREGLVNGNVLQNGMTNGLGGPQGLTNGNGMINGTGLVNGNGMVNGIGLVNGNGPGFTNGTLRTPSLRSNENAISPKRTSFVMLIVYMLIVVSVFAVLTYDDEPGYEGPRVDGDFSDWDDVQLYSDTGGSSIPSLDVVEYGLNPVQNKILLYARAQDNWMTSGNIDRLFIFIDEDGDETTGYLLEGIGADYYIEVYGWDSNIKGKTINSYTGEDQNNWNAWQTCSGISTAMVGQQIEISVPSSQLALSASHKMLFLTMRDSGVAEICAAQISDGVGSLVVTQIPSDTDGIISSDDAIQIEFSAIGMDVTVTGISFDTTGAASASVTGLPLTFSIGSTTTLTVSAPITGLDTGTFVGIDVSTVSCDGIVNIGGEGLKAYAHAAPVNISVDGAFADWSPVGKSSDTVGEIENPNVDISEYASA